MNRIKELCARRGIKQKELVSLVGTSQPTVSDWFSQKKNPTGERMKKLCEVLKVDRGVILGYDPDPMAASAFDDHFFFYRPEHFDIEPKKKSMIKKIISKMKTLDADGIADVEEYIDFILSKREQK